MNATTPNPWLSRLAGKTSEEMAAILRYELSYAWFADTSRVCLPAITAAIEAIQALERERCAKVAEDWMDNSVPSRIRALSPAAPEAQSDYKTYLADYDARVKKWIDGSIENQRQAMLEHIKKMNAAQGKSGDEG